MHSPRTTVDARSEPNELGRRAISRVAWRLLPFVFLIYIVNYIDRVNVSFANLRMSTDLGFSDRVYGLGVGMFYVTYVLFEIPGAIIVERWSARKWIARIMISWGTITIMTGFVHTARQFYAARFLLGIAESSFFPGMIVYLTHWFRSQERSRAIACLYAAVPAASLFGSPLAGWLLGVHWCSLAGWRWLFILEGVPAVILGIITIFYLTDLPEQAAWLPSDERTWLVNELQTELEAKRKIRNYTILEAFCDRRILSLTLAWFLSLTGSLGTIYWIPTFVKRLSGFSDRTVTSLLLVPALIGIAGMLVNGWHSDKRAERLWHTATPLIAAGLMFAILIVVRQEAAVADFVLASRQWVPVRVLPNVLGDSNPDVERIRSGSHVRIDQFDWTARRIRRELWDWFSERSNAFADGQLRIHCTRLFRRGNTHSQSRNQQLMLGRALDFDSSPLLEQGQRRCVV